MIIRQLLLSIGVFLIIFVGLNVRMFINDRIFVDRDWSFKKHWKLLFVIALAVAVAAFIYLRVTGQTQL